MAAAASTICSLLFIATLLGLCSQAIVVHFNILQSSCTARSPVALVLDSTRGKCIADNQSNKAIQQCVDNCRKSSSAFGILSSSNHCECSNDTTFDLNYCCTDLQCDLVCGKLRQHCNPETNRCEYTLPIPLGLGCGATCTHFGYAGFVETGRNCTCKVCSGISNASPETCAGVSSALFGISATSAGNGACVVTADATIVCDLVNQLDVPLIG